MYEPSLTAIAKLEELLDNSAHALYTNPQPDPFKHGCQVGECWGYQRAIQEIKNALSASEKVESEL
jgi:hypothetical protein